MAKIKAHVDPKLVCGVPKLFSTATRSDAMCPVMCQRQGREYRRRYEDYCVNSYRMPHNFFYHDRSRISQKWTGFIMGAELAGLLLQNFFLSCNLSL